MNLVSIFLTMFLILVSTSQVEARIQAIYYISPVGDDNNPGTLEAPFKTISRARDVVHSIIGNMNGDIEVCLRGGTYFLASPVQFGVGDGGTNGHQVIYKAYPGETPIISGATQVTGWTLQSGHIYRATLDRNTKLRSLIVNGVRAHMTASKDIKVDPTAVVKWGAFKVSGTEPWAQTSGTGSDGVQFKSDQVGVYANPSDLEIEWAWAWCQNIACARDMTSENGMTIIKMQQPYGAIASRLRWCALGGSKDNKGYAYTIHNALELLNTPGDFYFKRTTKTLYYYSRGEDMSIATVFAPQSEGLIRVYGESTSSRVHNLCFYGITFQHDHYLLTDVGGSRGFVGSQSSAVFIKFREDGDHNKAYFTNEDVPQATLELRNCDGIRIERCRFLQLGSPIAVSLYNDVINTAIIGNVFWDLAGNAINIGHPQHYAIPLMGSIFRTGVAGLCKNDLISDNLVRSVSTEFKRIEGICGYDLDSVEISHNDVEILPYGAIAVGWWWGANGSIPPPALVKNIKIDFNRAGFDHSRLSDGGCIYVMSPTLGGEIIGNYIFHSPAYGAIMPDEGSAYWQIKSNVIEKSARWYFSWFGGNHDLVGDNNFVNAGKDNGRFGGKNCFLTNTHLEPNLPWPADVQAMINFAGIEPAYRDIMSR
jgi:hypothetical protein